MGLEPIAETTLQKMGSFLKEHISDPIVERFFSGGEMLKSALMSIAKPRGKEAFIPGPTEGPLSIARAGANVAVGAVAAPLAVLQSITSPLAPIGKFVTEGAQLQERQQREAIRDPIIMRHPDIPRLPKEEFRGTFLPALLGGAAEAAAGFGVGTALIPKIPSPAGQKAVEIVLGGAKKPSAKGELPPVPGEPAQLPGRVPVEKPFEVRLGGDIQKEINESVEEAVKEGTFVREKGERIFKTVARGIAEGEIDVPSWPRIREKLMGIGGITQKEADVALANEFLTVKSTAGRELGMLGRIGKLLSKELDDDVGKALVNKLPESSYSDLIFRGARIVETTRRGLLVTQLATADRNAISQGGRGILAIFDDVVEGTLNRLAGRPAKESFDPLFQDVLGVLRRISPKARTKLADAFEAMPETEARLMNRPLGELVSGKVINVLNTPSRLQEGFFRRLGFEARFRTNLHKIGMEFDELTPAQMTELSLGPERSPFNMAAKDAIDHGLEMTLAKRPSGAGAAELLRTMSHPLFTAFGNPFPRFWMNAVKFLYEHNPAGMTSMLNPKTIEKIAHGNFEDATKILTKAMTGTLMLGAAGAVRESNLGGEKWYEINTSDGKKVIDMRPFAPFSTALFIWDAIYHPEKLEPIDWLEGIVSINRIAGTGLMAVDAIRGKDLESAKKVFNKWAGLYAGGFTTVLRTPKDFIAQFSEEEGTARAVREHPILGPTLNNIPFLSRNLPELKTPFKVEPVRSIAPMMRQLTGLSLKEKGVIERWTDELDIPWQSVYPRTGDEKADRLVVEKMGAIAEQRLLPLLQSKEFQDMQRPMKSFRLKQEWSAIRLKARGQAQRENPVLFREILEKRIDPDLLEIFKGRRQMEAE